MRVKPMRLYDLSFEENIRASSINALVSRMKVRDEEYGVSINPVVYNPNNTKRGYPKTILV